MVEARQDIIKVEAAYTLGCVCMSNSANMKAALDHKDFSFVHILLQLCDEDAPACWCHPCCISLQQCRK